MKAKIFYLALMEGKILFARFFGGQKDWNDSRTTVLDAKKLLLLKKILFLHPDLIIKSFQSLT